MSTPDRTSSQLVALLGVELAAELTRGKLANVFRTAAANRATVPAAVRRLSTANLVPAAVNIEQYHSALSFALQAGAQPAAARTLALVFVDVARTLNTTVEQLIAAVPGEHVAVLQQRAYEIANLLRSDASQLTAVSDVPLSDSGIADRLLGFEPVVIPSQGDWSTGCFDHVVDPPAVQSITGRRAQFDPKGRWFAYSQAVPGTPVRVLTQATWQPVVDLEIDSAAGDRVSALTFSPQDPLLAVGLLSGQQGLAVFSTVTWQPVPNAPAFSRVNSAEFSPDGKYLAVVHSVSANTTQAFLTVVRRSDWSVVHTQTALDAPFVRPIVVKWSPDGDKLAVYGNRQTDARLVVLNTSDWSVKRNRPIPGGTLAYGGLGPSMDWLPDNNTVVIPPNSEFAPSNLTVYRTDINQRFTVPVSLGLTYSAVATTGSEVLVSGAINATSDTVSVVSTETWQEIHTQSFDTQQFPGISEPVTLVSQLALSPGSVYLAVVNSSPENPVGPLIFESC